MTRRDLVLAPFLPLAAAQQRRPRVACILNVYFPNSHADVFMSRILEGYRLNGTSHRPRVEVAAMYVDQFPHNDMAREQAEEYGVKIYSSAAEAVRLGGSKIAVDGVAIIGEHGDYPRTPRGNFMYPRRRRFDEVTGVMQSDGRVVPLLNDKYFAYEWSDARHMYDRVRAMKIPFQCGSTLPLTWRRPPLEFAPGTRFDELMAVSFSDLEEHAYHAIELLQAMAERRAGGETGVAEVRYAEGDEVWKAAKDGLWSRSLLDAALSKRVNPPPPDRGQKPEAIFVRYASGLRASIINLNSQTRDYLFAAKETGRAEPHASCFYIQLYNHNHWSFMVRKFEDLVISRKQPDPPERTLVANGIMLAGLESRRLGGKPVATPEMAVTYRV